MATLLLLVYIWEFLGKLSCKKDPQKKKRVARFGLAGKRHEHLQSKEKGIQEEGIIFSRKICLQGGAES